MIAALLVLEAMSTSDEPLSQMLEPFSRYFDSGEINTEVTDQEGHREARGGLLGRKQDFTDGLTVEYEDWWFNCRPSNTEPLLRLNLEARTEELMEDARRRDEVPASDQGERANGT